MISRPLYCTALLFVLAQILLAAQTASFPFIENFDTVAVPRLPAGWSTSSRKSPAGDFSTSASLPLSAPNSVVSSDAKIAQSLISPEIDFSGKIAGTLQFYERRTASHNSGLVIDAVVNGDTAAALQIGDTLGNSGTTNYVIRNLTLPSSLNGKRGVRFRWRVVGNGTGAAGTLRVDNVKISVRKMIDLAVTSLAVDPANPHEQESLSVQVYVANRALSGFFSFTLQLFDDSDPDSLGTHENKVDEQNLTHSFGAADSAAFTLIDPSMHPGRRRLSVRLILPGDEDSTNNTLSKSIIVGYSPRTLLINEIMYAPSGGSEWVECVNNSADTIALSQWRIGDNTAFRGIIHSQFPSIVPRQYFLLARDSSILNAFPSIHAPIIKADLPVLNNDFDAVVILDPSGVAVDSVASSFLMGGQRRKISRENRHGGSIKPPL